MADTAARDAIQRGIVGNLRWLNEQETRELDAKLDEILFRRGGPRDRLNAEIEAAPVFIGSVTELEQHIDTGDVCNLCAAFGAGSEEP